jgi:tetratricopeptide (TPR) repeat protein
MAAGAHSGPRATALDEVRERYRAVEAAEPGHDRTRYVEALKAFLATAERHADEIASEGPDVAPLLGEAAMAFYRASDPELAERAVDLGLRLTPGAATLLHHKALVLLALNRDLPEVVRLVDEALQATPNDRGLWATRGDALRLLGRPDDAAEAYLRAQELDLTSTEYVDRALKVAPHQPRALRLKVELARVRGGELPALGAAEELLAQNPGDAELQLSRAELLAAVGRREEALAAVRQLPRADASPAQLLEMRLMFDLGRGPEAIGLARTVVGAPDVSDPRALEEIAKFATTAEPELALTARQRLGALEPRNVQNLLDLRQLAASLGRHDVALAACHAVLEANPENLEAMRGVAEVEAAAGHPVEALAAYRHLAKSHPHAVGELRKALALARASSRPEDVREFAETILAVEPTDAEARSELASTLAASGDRDGALEEYDALLAAHPGDVAILLAKRDLLSSAHDHEGLRPVLDELFRLDPTRTDVAVERGNLWLEHAYDLPEGSTERSDAARAALVAYERASSDPGAADPSLLGIARASRLVEDHDRALGAYTDFLSRESNRGRLDIRKERGHALREHGRLAEAVEEYERAIAGGLEDADLLWGAADAYARLGQSAPALRLLDVLLRREPNEPVFLRRQGQLLLEAGRRDEALRVLQQAVRGAERDPQAYFEVAEALRAQGAYADAIGYYQQGLQLEPKHRHGRLALAETLLLAGRYPDVLTIVDPLLKEDPNDLAAWKARADAWRALGRSSEVLYSLEAILLLDPESGAALLEMYRLRRDRGEVKEAYEALDRLLRSGAPEGKEATLHLELGDLAAKIGQPDAANAAYERAAALDPAMRAEIGIRRARLRLSAGRPDLALEVLDATLGQGEPAAAPSISALLLRAELLSALERPAEARAAFEEVRRREPKSPTAAAGIARSMVAEGRHEAAVSFLSEALPQLPAEETPYLLLAEAESGLGHLEKARDGLNRGLAALPRSVALWSRLGEVAVARQAWPEGANALAHALALTPGSVDLLLRAGFVAERLGHPNEALAFYERATEAEPSHKQAWTRRGLALLATGRPVDAAASFDRALSIDSDFAPAKDGKKLAGQKTRDAEIQRHGREALLLEARLGRPLTKNDLFVTLHVPYEFLAPVLREIGQAPKVDLAHLDPEEARELDTATYHLISAALERRPVGIERRGFTLADVAVLSPNNASLGQIQKLFGYLRAVLEAEVRPEQLTLPPDVEELARQALTLPTEHRTLFQLVRTLRVGVYKARLIKAVEEAGAATGTRLPALDLGAYSPEFRPTAEAPTPAPAPSAAAVAPEPHAEPPTAATVPTPSPPVPGKPSTPPAHAPPAPPMTAKAGDRCVGCGGLASVVHLCGAPLCRACVVQFPKCPKCSEKITSGSTRPIPGVGARAGGEKPTGGVSGPLGALRGVFHRGSRNPAEPPVAPSPVPRASGARRGPLHRPEHEGRGRGGGGGGAPPVPPAPSKKAAAGEPAKVAAVPPPPSAPKAAPKEPNEPSEAEPPEEPAPSTTKPKPSRTDDEPRL